MFQLHLSLSTTKQQLAINDRVSTETGLSINHAEECMQRGQIVADVHFSSRNTCCLYLLVPTSSLQGFLKYTLKILGHVVRSDIMLSERAVQQSTAGCVPQHCRKRHATRKQPPQRPATVDATVAATVAATTAQR